MVLLFLCGALSMLAQVILLRELVAAFYGVDLIYLLALGAWLLWTAAGALIGRRALAPSAARAAAVLIAAGAAIPLELLVIRRLRLLVGGVPGAFLPLPEQILVSALCLVVPGALLGWFFQLAARRYLADVRSAQCAVRGAADVRNAQCAVRSAEADVRSAKCAVRGAADDGRGAADVRGAQCAVRGARRESSVGRRPPRTLARAYAIESMGAMVAGLLTTCAVTWRIQNLALALAASALASVVALASVRFDAQDARVAGPKVPGSSRLPLVAAASLVTVACAIGLLWSRAFDLLTAAWNHPGVIETTDTPYGRATITEQAGQVALYENDALVFDSESTAAEELTHLSLMQHSAPRRILLVEGTSAGILPYALEHGADRVDALEGDRALVELLARRLPTLHSALSRGTVHLVFDDPRRAIANCVALPCGDRYDAIVIASPEPASAQANRFFTREFFAQCARRLAPGGIVSLRLPSVENFWTPPIAARASAIYGALTEVFADVVVLPGSANVVVASDGRLTRDPTVLSDRLTSRAVHASLVTSRYVRYLYSNDRYAEIEHLLRRSRLSNTDARPASYQATALLWVSKFVPAAATWELTSIARAFGWRSPWPWLIVAALGGGALLLRARRSGNAPVVVAIAAAAGMGLESVLLVHYQLKHGVVFRDLGVLLMCVMGGLAAGALVAERVHEARSAWWARVVLVGFSALSLLTAVAIEGSVNTGLVSSSLALTATGVAVAFVFASMASSTAADARRLVSPFYAADVLGGAVGSVVASLVLIPLIGLPSAAGWAGAIAAIGALSVPRGR